MDLITQLPNSADSDGEIKTAILNVVDRYTKRAHFSATTDHCTAAEVAEILYEHVFRLHGIPRQIISDRGPQFAGAVFKEFCQKLGVRSTMSTAYHPETDGQTERVNQTLEQYLRIYCNHRQDDWVRYLSTAEFAYNNATHESTKLSPFYIEYGWNPRMAPDVIGELSSPRLEDLFMYRKDAREQASAALVAANERMKWYFDLHKSEMPFKIGDQVMLHGKDLRVRVSSAKLAAQQYGPYKIIEQLGPVTFKLKLPRQMKVHPVFHASKLLPYHKDEIAGRNPKKPPPVIIDGEKEFEVESILNSRIYRGKVQYLVKWAGYLESTWEPLPNLENSIELLDAFHVSHPDAPRPISYTNARPDTTLFSRSIWNNDPVVVEDDGIIIAQIIDDKIIPLLVKPHSDNAQIPTRGSAEAAGYDLRSVNEYEIPPHQQVVVETDIAIKCPPGTYARIAPRSGLAAKYRIDVMAGVIDADYRGTIKILLINHGDAPYNIIKGDKVAQLILERIVTPEVQVVDELDATQRGQGGFGSTGKQ